VFLNKEADRTVLRSPLQLEKKAKYCFVTKAIKNVA